MVSVDPVIVGSLSAALASMLTYLVGRKDANTKANETSVTALTSTIAQLQQHITHLDHRLQEMERQLDAVSSENITLIREVHELRRALAAYQNAD